MLDRFAALATIEEVALSQSVNFLSLLKITLLPSLLKSRFSLMILLLRRPSFFIDLTLTPLLEFKPPWSSNNTCVFCYTAAKAIPIGSPIVLLLASWLIKGVAVPEDPASDFAWILNTSLS